MRTNALSHEVVLVRRWHQLLIKSALVHVLVAQFQLLVVRYVVLLPYVYHGRRHVGKLTFLVSSFHPGRNISLVLN